MIEVTNLVKRYGNNTVLNQATFQIQDGQLTTIPGPSGCGKSTMLHCMNRLERFDRGRLRIGDVEVVGTEEKQLTAAEEKQLTKRLRDRVGIVFQNFNLFPHQCLQAVPRRRLSSRNWIGRKLASRYAAPLTIWPVVAVFYLLLTFLLTRVAEYLEQRWRPVTRA